MQKNAFNISSEIIKMFHIPLGYKSESIGIESVQKYVIPNDIGYHPGLPFFSSLHTAFYKKTITIT